jgi:hypothetical protein
MAYKGQFEHILFSKQNLAATSSGSFAI